MISAEKIPNNVGLSGNKRLQRALEHWQPQYIQWWKDMGPQGFQDYHQVYVRTAVSVDPAGWAHFEYVKIARVPLGDLSCRSRSRSPYRVWRFRRTAGLAGSAGRIPESAADASS